MAIPLAIWSSYGPRQERTGQTTDPTRPAAMLTGITRRIEPGSLPIRDSLAQSPARRVDRQVHQPQARPGPSSRSIDAWPRWELSWGLGVRFDSSDLGNGLAEIVAYGTAATVRPGSSS